MDEEEEVESLSDTDDDDVHYELQEEYKKWLDTIRIQIDYMIETTELIANDVDDYGVILINSKSKNHPDINIDNPMELFYLVEHAAQTRSKTKDKVVTITEPIEHLNGVQVSVLFCPFQTQGVEHVVFKHNY